MNTNMCVINVITRQIAGDAREPDAESDHGFIDPQGHREITIQDHHGRPLHLITQVSSETLPGVQTVCEIPVKHEVHSVAVDSATFFPSSVNVPVASGSEAQYMESSLRLTQPKYPEVPIGSAPPAASMGTGTSPANQASGNLFVCECGQSFSQRSGLKTHMKVHTGVKPFQCNICNKRFAHKQNKKFHMRRHTGERPYKCDRCDRAFICVALLNRHKREHEGNYAYKCNICDQGFLLKRNFVEHMNAHTNTRPFHCNTCNKSFSRREALRVHKKMHTGETPYVCKECGKAFPLRTRLEIHMRRHTGETPYMCLDCGKAFYTSPQLNDHQRRYQGTCQDLDYKCQECGLSFKKQCGLSAHMRIHQDDVKKNLPSCDQCKQEISSQRHRCRPSLESSKGESAVKSSEIPGQKNMSNNPHVQQKYMCDLCNKAYTSLHSLKRHFKTHSHNKEMQKIKTTGTGAENNGGKS